MIVDEEMVSVLGIEASKCKLDDTAPPERSECKL